MAGNVLETTISDGMFTVLGDPAFIGVGVVAFFMAAVFLVPTHPAVKTLAFFGGIMLALPFLGWGMLVLSLGGGIIIWFALRRVWG